MKGKLAYFARGDLPVMAVKGKIMVCYDSNIIRDVGIQSQKVGGTSCALPPLSSRKESIESKGQRVLTH